MDRSKFTNARTLVQPAMGTMEDIYKTIRVNYTPSKFGEFSADLFDYINDPNQMSQIIEAMSVMEQGDLFKLRLSSGGGCLSTTDALVHAIRTCKGEVQITASGNIASAATLILLEAHSFELTSNFTALIHNGSLWGVGGTLSEFKTHSKFYSEQMEKLLREAYAGFLSGDEINALIAGKDFVMDAEEWVERHKQRNKWMEEEMAKFEKEAQKALKPAPKPRKKKVSSKPSEPVFKGLEETYNESKDYLAPPIVK